MRLPDSFLEELRARTPLGSPDRPPHETGAVRPAMESLLPFHNEKSPSFYIYDDGYHCFGCGAHGDAIGFVHAIPGRDLHGRGRDAGGRGRAGGAEPSAEAAQAEQRRLDLHGVLGGGGQTVSARFARAGGSRTPWPICAAAA